MIYIYKFHNNFIINLNNRLILYYIDSLYNMKRLFFQEAYNQALKSEMNFNHGAVLIYRGKIIGRGYNTYFNTNSEDKNSLHAEAMAIQDGLKRINEMKLKHCNLIIIRVNGGGNCVNSKPCERCTRLINKHCIKKVYYS